MPLRVAHATALMPQLDIAGMICESCAAHVKHALEQVPRARSAEVSYAQTSAGVTLDAGVSPGALIAAVTGLGYRTRLADTPSRQAQGRISQRGTGICAAESHVRRRRGGIPSSAVAGRR